MSEFLTTNIAIVQIIRVALADLVLAGTVAAGAGIVAAAAVDVAGFDVVVGQADDLSGHFAGDFAIAAVIVAGLAAVDEERLAALDLAAPGTVPGVAGVAFGFANALAADGIPVGRFVQIAVEADAVTGAAAVFDIRGRVDTNIIEQIDGAFGESCRTFFDDTLTIAAQHSVVTAFQLTACLSWETAVIGVAERVDAFDGAARRP